MRTRITTAAALLATAVAMAAPVSAQAATAPQVKATWATGVGASAVDIHATVNPGEAATSAKVEYLTASTYEANLATAKPAFTGATSSPVSGTALGSGPDDVEFLRRLSFLKASTAYRYRVAATNSEGTTLGPPRLFTTTETAPVFSLPDGRGWEMVSPIDKNGGEIQGPGESFGGGVLQASGDGSSVTYSSRFSFGNAPQGAPPASQYLSRRGSGGWVTENATTPTLAGSYGPDPDGVPFQLFSGDLARGLVFDPQLCDTAPCPRRYLLRTSATGALAKSPEATDLAFAGANPDLSQVVFATTGNLYRWSGGAMTLINVGAPGATLAAQSGAVSANGSRVYFAHGANLYLRDGAQTVQVDEAQGGGGAFQTASSDGAIAFFIKDEGASGDHLYRWSATTKVATDLTPGGEVQGVLGASPDGSHLYYLTPAGLFLSQGATTTKAAAGADASNYPPATGTSRVASNGTLAFISSALLSDYDNNGLAEVYLYSPASKALTCASCNPTGARPIGPSSIPGAVANGKAADATRIYKPRVLTSSADRLFFDSRDALVLQDTNNDRDVYQWEAGGVGSCTKAIGCVALISSGRATDGAVFLDASADGSSAFFLTDASLVPTDPGAVDVYAARVGGGFPAPEPPIPCLGDACQAIPSPPEDPGPGTAFFKPEGNPPLTYPKAKKPKKPGKNKKGKKKSGKGKNKQTKGKKGAGR